MNKLGGLIDWYERNRYNSLFISIVLLILTPPFLFELPILSVVIYILLSIVILNCINIIIRGRHKPIVLWIVGSFVLVYTWVNFLVVEKPILMSLLGNAFLVLVFGLAFSRLVKEIFNYKKVTGHIVLGAIAAYLLLGLMGAFLFDVIEILYPESFNTARIFTGFYQEIYLSFITISTLGYGDITPITPQGQAAAIFVAITGQLYLAILMAMLVGKFLKDSDW